VFDNKRLGAGTRADRSVFSPPPGLTVCIDKFTDVTVKNKIVVELSCLSVENNVCSVVFAKLGFVFILKQS